MPLLRVSIFAFLLSALQPTCAALSQLCKVDPIHDVDICMVFATPQHDPSTYHLAFSGRFPQGRGWAAFGQGSVMDGALMFVFYPDEQHNGLTVSVRSTSGHYPPQLSSPHSNLSVLQTSVDGEGYYNAEVKCKSCRALGREKDGYEHWLWSANDYQTLRTAEADAPLQMHTLYGRFETIVEQSPSGNLTRAGGDRTSMGIKGPPASSKDLVRAHGSLMLLAFLAVYPAGVLGILHGGKRAFWMHAGAQATATACVLVAGAFAIFAPPAHSHTGPLLLSHRVFGSAVLIVVVAQGGIGYMHHRTFVLTRERSHWSLWHRPLGYVVLLLGCANAALGLYIRGMFDSIGVPLLLVGLTGGTWAAIGRIIKSLKGPVEASISDEDFVETSELESMIPK